MTKDSRKKEINGNWNRYEIRKGCSQLSFKDVHQMIDEMPF
jgi:hypothetical protein